MRRVGFGILIIVLLIIINGLVASIFDLLSKQNVVKDAQRKFEIEKAKNAKLKAEYSLSQDPQFIEKEARDKLFLTKPGEESLVIPDNLLPKEVNLQPVKADSYWKQWFDLLF